MDLFSKVLVHFRLRPRQATSFDITTDVSRQHRNAPCAECDTAPRAPPSFFFIVDPFPPLFPRCKTLPVEPIRRSGDTPNYEVKVLFVLPLSRHNYANAFVSPSWTAGFSYPPFTSLSENLPSCMPIFLKDKFPQGRRI